MKESSMQLETGTQQFPLCISTLAIGNRQRKRRVMKIDAQTLRRALRIASPVIRGIARLRVSLRKARRRRAEIPGTRYINCTFCARHFQMNIRQRNIARAFNARPIAMRAHRSALQQTAKLAGATCESYNARRHRRAPIGPMIAGDCK